MRSVPIVATVALLSWITQAKILAGPITYTITTTATGTLGGTAFTDAAITVTFAGDTSNIVAGDTLGGSTYTGTLANIGTGTVVIAGLGAVALTDPAFVLSTFDNTTVFGESGVVIGDSTNGTAILAATGPAFYGYDLTGPFGPLSAGGGLGNGGGPSNTFPTSGGSLEFPRDEPPPDVGSTFTAVATQSLPGYQGGTAAAPVYLVGGAPIGELTGTISGAGTEDYYWFYWGGGVFAATASIASAPAGSSYVFSAGVASSCNSVGSETLNSGDSYSDTISVDNLAAGQYCIGLDANNGNDPTFSLTFDTPVSGVPEPGTFVLVTAGLIALGAARRNTQRKAC